MSQNITEQWIRARCKEDGDCLLWRLGVKDSGRPTYRAKLVDGRRPSIQIARKWWELTRGPIPKGRCVTVTCGNPRCLEHLELVTRSEVNSRLWQNAATRAKKTRALTESGKRRAKLDMEKARYIRESNATLKEVAQELGISFQLASRVRRGIAWKEQASPFAGLFAANDSARRAA